MIDGNTFPANIDVCKVKGSKYRNLYGIRVTSPCDVMMSKLWVKN